MKLSELIAQIGDENVEVQPLTSSIVSVNTLKKEGRITFATSTDKSKDLAGAAVFGPERQKFVGVVLWLPADKIPAELKGRL